MTQVVHRISSPEALAWSERCRHLYGDFGLDYTEYALGPLTDRCFTIAWRTDVLAGAARAAAVPPFRAMAMARDGQRAGGRRTAGAPPRGRPAGDAARRAPARAAVTRLLAEGAPLGYTNAQGCRRCAGGIAAPLRATGTASTSTRRSVLVVGRRVGRLHARVPGRVRRRRPRRRARARLPVLPQRAARPGCRAGRHPGRPGDPLGADARAARRRRDRCDGLIVASPSNPTGTVLAPSARTVLSPTGATATASS